MLLSAICAFIFVNIFNWNRAIQLQIALLLSCLDRINRLQATALLLQRNNLELERRRRRRRRHPYFWGFPRPQESWFEIHYLNHNIPWTYFRRQLRLDRHTFNLLLDEVRPHITRQDTRMRKCIPPEKILAIGPHRLGHGSPYVGIGPNFNVGRSTVLEAVEDVVDALLEIKDRYIIFPNTAAEIIQSRQTFALFFALPNVVGAIDGTRIKIKTPVENGPDYFSRYQDHDIVVQGVVDGNSVFLDVEAGYPGSMHDARVLRNSAIYTRAEQEDILKGLSIAIGGQEI